MRINKEESLGIFIDFQERLMPHIHNNEDLLKNSQILAEGLQVLGIPILVTEQYKKGLGDTLSSLKEVLTTDEYHEKTAFSCCDNDSIQKSINYHQKRYIIIAGIESHICVLQTVIDLITAGFTPLVVTDCISSRKEKDLKIALKRMQYEGAILTTYESILFELCRVSGTDSFKKISKLIK